MKKILALLLVLGLVNVASAGTILIKGAVGSGDDADPSTFYVTVTADSDVPLAGLDLQVNVPAGLNAFDDVNMGGADDESTYMGPFHSFFADDRESYRADGLNAIIVDDGITIDVNAAGHPDPGNQWILLTAGALPALPAGQDIFLARFGFQTADESPIDDQAAAALFVDKAQAGPGGIGGAGDVVEFGGIFVPEPATMLLLGLAGVFGLIRRK